MFGQYLVRLCISLFYPDCLSCTCNYLRNRYKQNGMLKMVDRNRQIKAGLFALSAHDKFLSIHFKNPNNVNHGCHADSCKLMQKSIDIMLFIFWPSLPLLSGKNTQLFLGPEKFQNEQKEYDVVITCEGRVYDQVLEDFESREESSFKPVSLMVKSYVIWLFINEWIPTLPTLAIHFTVTTFLNISQYNIGTCL